MSAYVYPALFAAFVWWFSTGVILFLDNLPRSTFRWSLLGATLVMLSGVYGLMVSVHMSSVAGAYLGFASALAVWAWLEITFYMGYITGPRRHACVPGCQGWRHFGHAVQVSLHHELAIVLLGAGIVWISRDASNSVGLHTFLILALMHESARINVFLGVRNLSEQFVPEQLDHLRSFLRKRSMNPFFPLAITLATGVWVMLLAAIPLAEADPAGAVGLTLLATMLGLAILEHWFLVLPLPADRLWQWSLKAKQWRTRRPGIGPLRMQRLPLGQGDHG